MDLLLQICDSYFLDRFWANLVPLSAFATPPEFATSFNSSSTILPVVASASKWTQFIARLPHPPITADSLALLYAQPGAPLSVPPVSAWPRDYVPRQVISLVVLTLIGIHIIYFLFAGLSYAFIFNHDMMRHPRFLKNQVRLEIRASLQAFPLMTLLTLPWFQAEVMGYSRLYDGVDTYGYLYLVLSVPL